MPAPRLTVIGLDAATLDVVDPLVAAGELPNLARLFEAGSFGRLRSTTHPLTPQAWATMVTGVNAARHGLWDFSQRDETGYGLTLVNGSFRRAPALWDHLVAAGLRVGLVNVPFTWPAPDVDGGFVIAGLDASERDDGMTHPAALLDELRARFGPLEVDHSFPLDDTGEIDLEQVRRVCKQRVAITRWLAERHELDLLFVVFMAADHIQHLAWPEWEGEGALSRVADVYRTLDQAVGELVDGVVDGGDVMVVSDHGGGGLKGAINLNTWLEQEGYLNFVGGGLEVLRREDFGRRALSLVFGLRRHLPRGLRRVVKRRLPGVRERAYQLRGWSVVDWTRTQAFAYGVFGNVVLNVRGRERHGTVDPDDYERVRDEIAAKALALRSEQGEPIVAAVHRREELFEGPYLDRVPDLIVEFRDYAWLGVGDLQERRERLWDTIRTKYKSRQGYAGSHRHDGLLALAGPSAARGTRLEASILDVAPTILYLLRLPVPSTLEGRIVSEAIDEAVLDARVPEYDEEEAAFEAGPARTYAADAEVESRLRDLGYLG